MKRQGAIRHCFSVQCFSFEASHWESCLVSALRGRHASGPVIDGRAALQVVVCVPVSLVSESPFHLVSACHLGV